MMCYDSVWIEGLFKSLQLRSLRVVALEKRIRRLIVCAFHKRKMVTIPT